MTCRNGKPEKPRPPSVDDAHHEAITVCYLLLSGERREARARALRAIYWLIQSKREPETPETPPKAL
tara:strand:- start:10373 stop:10573 length:201 start_codon:yes stop_codon:yes gene_type:complete